LLELACAAQRVNKEYRKEIEAVYTEDGEHAEMKYDYTTRKYIPSGRRYNIITELTQRKSSLQRNRVFKVDTNLSEVTI
jgi:hypothetical protein